MSLGNIWLLILESVLESVLNRADANFLAILEGEFGWGGRIRTFTIHINSVVSYRLDHAPAVVAADLRPSKLGRLRLVADGGGFF